MTGTDERLDEIEQHGGVVSAAPNVVQEVVDASAVVPGVQALVSASADTEPEAGELWRVGDEDEALLVWVRRNFGDGAVDVVPVVLDADFADEYSVLVDPADSPLTVDLALLVSLRVHVHRAAFLDRIGSLDVSGRVEDVAAAMRAGAPVAGSSVAAIVSDDDERIEYRQALRDLLADWSPSAWLSREHAVRDSGGVMTPDERRRLREAEGLADLCSRAGAVCGRGLLAEVEHLTAQLCDARAEIERLRSGYVDHVLARERDQLRAKLAAERAKVERVAVIRAEWGERKADEPCHELYVALGRALAGGEQ